MRTDTFGEGRLFENARLNVSAAWGQLSKGMRTLFNGDRKSDWEKKTGLPWKEWCTWGESQKLDSEQQILDQYGGCDRINFGKTKHLSGAFCAVEKHPPGWRWLIRKLKNSFEEGSESELEKKIGMPWHEWYRWD